MALKETAMSMISATDVAECLINSLPLDNLKLQKLLYYSQAVHLVLHDKRPLFPDPIEAWDYGPVVPRVYHKFKQHGLDIIPSTGEQPVLQYDEQKTVDIVIRTFGNMSGPELIDQTHYEWPWRNAYRPTRPSNVISIDSMYEYFKENLYLPERESNTDELNSENIKASFFKNIKACVDLIIPPNDDANFTESPSVDIEAIAIKFGITDIKQIPRETIFDKHAILVDTIIYIDERGSKGKQRFSIAHEIFHFLTRWPRGDLMQAVARQGETWKKMNAGSAEAVEEEIADYFAANLLIPTERFALWEDKTDEEIALAFGVEPRCIKKRRDEIEYELHIMIPKDLSSDVELEEPASLSFDELDHILETHSTHDIERV